VREDLDLDTTLMRAWPWDWRLVRPKSANLLEGGQDYCLAIFVTFGPLRVRQARLNMSAEKAEMG